MRITCRDVNAFLANLATPGTVVYNRVVYLDITRQELTKPGVGVVAADVVLQATALLEFVDAGGQAIVVCGVGCGRDNFTAGGCKSGTETATREQQRIEEFCRGKGLVVLPGVVDIS